MHIYGTLLLFTEPAYSSDEDDSVQTDEKTSQQQASDESTA